MDVFLVPFSDGHVSGTIAPEFLDLGNIPGGFSQLEIDSTHCECR